MKADKNIFEESLLNVLEFIEFKFFLNRKYVYCSNK